MSVPPAESLLYIPFPASIRLPQKLYEIFSGAKNADGHSCNARIQGVYDLLSGRFVYFSIDSYIKNDLASTHDYPLQKGDLMIRDRGYFIFDAFSKAIDSGADIIIRYKNKAKFMDPETGENIDLVKLLRKKGITSIINIAVPL